MTHEDAIAAILAREQEKGVVTEAELRQQLADVTNERDGLCITIRQLQVKHSVERDALQIQLNASEARTGELEGLFETAEKLLRNGRHLGQAGWKSCVEEFLSRPRKVLAQSVPTTDEQGAGS